MKNGIGPHPITLGAIEGVHIWKMPVFPDLRGRLFKAYVAGGDGSFPIPFSAKEHFFTESKKNVFRGMHFQGEPHTVTKVISIIQGATIDFLFDMRKESKTFGTLQIQELDEESPLSILIPTGVAHGYLVGQEKTLISYRMDGLFCEKCDAGISAELVAPYLPLPLGETIRSARDLALPLFDGYAYTSACL